MKVYIVFDGCYSDTHVEAVFDNRQRAEAFAQTACGLDGEVQEWEINEHRPIPKNKGFFKVTMDIDGNSQVEKEDLVYYKTEETINGRYNYKVFNRISDSTQKIKLLIMRVFAKDEKHAVKIVNEKRVQLIASGKFEEFKEETEKLQDIIIKEKQMEQARQKARAERA